MAHADIAPLVEPQYVIGEDHPSVLTSDAIFDAREALELGALELTIGRLTSQQLTGYRLVAEATVPYVEGEHFVDAAAYTDTNAVFHDYLFNMTGNEHLLQAYNNLGVKGKMHDVLRHATWCDPRVAQDHLDIVAAFEAGDRDAARQLISDHADRSKQTMRRALDESRARVLPVSFSPGRFEGKAVLVTGAAQGIGQTVARRIAAEGGAVALVDRSELVYEEAGGIAGSGCQAVGITADLETWEGASEAAEQAIEELGRIDVLINNVGGAINFKPFTEFTDAEIRAEITRSLLTTLYACRAALPSMVQQGHGVIVNVSSAATRGIYRIPYSAAKGGVNALTASLAMEYADAGIRVVATAPGGTAGPATKDLPGHTGGPQRHRTGLVPGAHRPDHRLVAAQADMARSTSRPRRYASWPPMRPPTSPGRCSLWRVETSGKGFSGKGFQSRSACHRSGPNTSYWISAGGTPRSINALRTACMNGIGPHR